MIEMAHSDILVQAEAAYKGAGIEPRRFADQAAHLVVRARREANAEALIVALHACARCHYAQLEHAAAKRLLDEAARLAARHALDTRLGLVLLGRAVVNIELGLLDAAQRDLDRAAAYVAGEGLSHLTLMQGALHQNRGKYAEAAERYRWLLSQPGVATEVQAKIGNNLALIESDRGRPDLALALLDHAAVAAKDAGPAVIAGVMQSRGRVLMQAGRFVESLREFDEAGRIYETSGWALGEHFLEYSDVLMDLRLLQEARTMAQQAFEQFRDNGVLLMAAEAQLRVARLALLDGDHAHAIAAAKEVVRSMRQQRRPGWVAMADGIIAEVQARDGAASRTQLTHAGKVAVALEQMGYISHAVQAYLTTGRLALALGCTEEATTALTHAATLSRRTPVLTRMKGRVAAALAAQLAHRDRDVLRHCRSGLNDLAQHRSALASMELRALASGHGVDLGAIGLATLLPTGSASRVLTWMERTRAAALVAVDAPSGAGIEDELAALRSVQADIAQTRRETGLEPPELLARQAALESRIRRASWAGSAATQAAESMVGTSELRRLLDGRVLVEYGVLRGELIAVVLDSRRTRLHRLGPLDTVNAEAEALLFALRRLSRRRTPASSLAARDMAAEDLRRLHALLIDPLGLAPDAPLVVVPAGELQRIPWSPLHTGPVTLAPSASFWARTRLAQQSSDRVVLAAGPQLPGAVTEVELLRTLHAGATMLLPPDSTVEQVALQLRGAGLAHLACHGSLRADNPTFSSLLFSDGPLTVHELTLRGLAPHRMVLASCDSGVGVVYDGNEMLGFVSALMARGTAGVVGSMVLLPDMDAVPLMRALHERVIAGATLADALHLARADMAQDDGQAFLTWCAFNAYGAA